MRKQKESAFSYNRFWCIMHNSCHPPSMKAALCKWLFIDLCDHRVAYGNEIVRLQRGATNQSTVNIRTRKKSGCISRVAASAVKNGNRFGGYMPETVGNYIADHRMHFLCLFGCCSEPRADCPHRLIRNDCF